MLPPLKGRPPTRLTPCMRHGTACARSVGLRAGIDRRTARAPAEDASGCPDRLKVMPPTCGFSATETQLGVISCAEDRHRAARYSSRGTFANWLSQITWRTGVAHHPTEDNPRR